MLQNSVKKGVMILQKCVITQKLQILQQKVAVLLQHRCEIMKRNFDFRTQL